ncbi:putative tyrosinase [Xylogone sp. PMI_703]|nr:putative tyrosinase [Xylogone sp. PMI_703]
MSPRDRGNQKDIAGQSEHIYTSIEAVDSEDNLIITHPQRTLDRHPLRILLISAIASLLLGFLAGNISQILPTPRIFTCRNPVVRKEWRVLSYEERQEYYRAVKCLATRPSRLGLNGTVYDDFAWVHTLSSEQTHNSSTFMPWHRAVLNLYEKILVEECSFTGHVPYWDWTLDWADLAHSSIWHPVSGFGGDGAPNGTTTVGWGRCVVDGPFKDLRPIYFNGSYHPHCISRGFHHKERKGYLFGEQCRPEAMGFIMRQEGFVNFVFALESTVHNMIHDGIAGDFTAFTASNDPLFFLHHGQLDRLWWQWQQMDPSRRLYDYSGLYETGNTVKATLKDTLSLGGLANDVTVGDVMDTQGGFLCYRY